MKKKSNIKLQNHNIPQELIKIENILNRMETTLNYLENLSRRTALKELQIEEDNDPFKILIGTMLSARSRDETTSKIVRKLFQKYKNVLELANAELNDIKSIIYSIGFYNTKSERIKQVSQIIVEKFHGIVPTKIEDLLALPGVGRKTANCVLVYAFNKPAIPVDIHVHRISNRIGIVKTQNVKKTEEELIKIVDKEYWLILNNIFVTYGQNICLPIGPKCQICSLKGICNFYTNQKKKFNEIYSLS
ncbi:MAG TPA: endonuclease III [Nitrososphaeraceae archaeon]|nr:endonuclease III [Nitrososphaeraceae archaeon]